MLTKSKSPKLKEMFKTIKHERKREVKTIVIAIKFNDNSKPNGLTLVHGNANDIAELLEKTVLDIADQCGIDLEDETNPADENL